MLPCFGSFLLAWWSLLNTKGSCELMAFTVLAVIIRTKYFICGDHNGKSSPLQQRNGFTLMLPLFINGWNRMRNYCTTMVAAERVGEIKWICVSMIWWGLSNNKRVYSPQRSRVLSTSMYVTEAWAWSIPHHPPSFGMVNLSPDWDWKATTADLSVWVTQKTRYTHPFFLTHSESSLYTRLVLSCRNRSLNEQFIEGNRCTVRQNKAHIEHLNLKLPHKYNSLFTALFSTLLMAGTQTDLHIQMSRVYRWSLKWKTRYYSYIYKHIILILGEDHGSNVHLHPLPDNSLHQSLLPFFHS